MQKRQLKILLVEDDMLSRLTLEQTLGNRGEVISALSKEEARFKINRHSFDIAFVDLDLDAELEGLKIIPYLIEKNVYVVVLSGREEESVVKAAYSLGCYDYLVKPYNSSSIDLVFKKFEQKKSSLNIIDRLKEKLHVVDLKLIDQLDVIATSLLSTGPVLITGETGTGKTFLAKLINELSFNKGQFIQVNCSEFSESLLESELFGHVKGAFTGAIKDKKGLLELANNGVLFLDEIATMPSTLQMKLLKAIEEKEFYPVGGERIVRSNFRLISACSENLLDKVESGEFRRDLYFRVEGFNIKLAPLRERRGDILEMISIFIKKNDRRFVLTDGAKEAMLNYQWPGNIRELQKVISMLSLKEKGIVEKSDLSFTKIFRKNDSVAFDVEKIKLVGLSAYLEEIEGEVLSSVLTENKQKVRKTLGDLKISNNTFYRIMDNVKSKSDLNVL